METGLNIKLNKYQSPLNEELKNSLPREVWEDIMEYTTSVKFIANLISPTREYIKDRPVMTRLNSKRELIDYEDGRKLIDLTNPHILEDMDFFRERALFFDKNGKYTNITPNPNPKSDYAIFWKEELRKWKDGVVREDGEWIPGELYHYWNYAPIWLVESINETDSARSRGERVKAFAKPWLGDYLYYHYTHQAKEIGQHGKILKTRGIGFSFKNAAESPRNLYVYPGTGNPNFHLASEKSFLEGDKGIWGKILDGLDWIAQHTPLPRMRTVDRRTGVLQVQLGYDDENGTRMGLQSSIHGISLKDNPDKARGIRGPLIHYEEDGLFPNLEKAWGVNRKAVEDGGTSFGFMLAGGTGGVEGKSFDGSEKLFYNPRAYNIYGIPNVFDRNSSGETICGFFWGAYLNRNNCYDLDVGEPDVIKSLVEICLDRYEVKYNSSDSNAITQKKAEEPITPQEAIMRTEGTVFPVADLKDHLETISVNRDAFLAENLVGDLVYDRSGKLTFKADPSKFPLRNYDITTGDKTGAIEIFELPKENAEGVVTRDRYIAGIDPIDSDTGQSLFSILVMDTFTDRLVAEYTGRPRTANEAYEITLRLLKFYNAEGNYESNLKGLFNYFDKFNALHYLSDVPQILKDMELSKATNLYGNKAKGTNANKKINSWGRLLQADWQKKRINEMDEEDLRLNLHTLRSFAYIQECIKWHSDGNFDRVSAGGMLFILREEKFKRTESAKIRADSPVKSLADDKFFSINYSGGTKGMTYDDWDAIK